MNRLIHPSVGSRWKKGDVVDRRTTLIGLSEILRISLSDASSIRYQLLHRAASALVEAERYAAANAVLPVHSFSNQRAGFEDYKTFGSALGVSVEYGKFVDAGPRFGRRLLLGWLSSLK